MKKTGFAANVLLMTFSMLVLRVASMASNVYIADKAGAEIMGLYHVIFAVFSFAVTVSVSGTNLAATRLVSEHGQFSGTDFSRIIKKCLAVSLTTSALSAIAMFVFADIISQKTVNDGRCTDALRLLSLTLPLIASSAVIKGALIAGRKAAAITVSQIAEDFSAILVTVLLLKHYANTPRAHMAIVMGNFISEIVAFGIDILMFKLLFSRGGMPKANTSVGKVLGICMPVALGSYLRSALVAAENVLIPMKLSQGGYSDPMKQYGIVRGMAMQLLLFPTVFIQAFSSMLVPEMSEMNAAYRKNGISHVSAIAIEMTMIFAFAAAAVFCKYHIPLAQKMYEEPLVGTYLGMLSLLVIPMYLDTVVDSMLKGLNEQVSSLKFNIIDSFLRIPAIWFVVPKYGIKGYIWILYASEIFNLSLSIGRLIWVAKVKISIRRCFVTPVFCAAVSAFVINYVPLNNVWSEIFLFGAIYIMIMFLLSGIYKKEIC